MKNLQDTLVRADTVLSDTIQKIDNSGYKIALVVDKNMKLLGVVSDGDVRRAILQRVDLDAPTSLIMNSKPYTMPEGSSSLDILGEMRCRTIHQIPIVDNNGCVVRLETLDELSDKKHLPNWVVVMAGGLGMRLRPLTETCPKPMLHVGGKPLLERILETFIDQGFSHFFLAVNYRADLIMEHFGDGSAWGVEITYLEENKRLGTAGALSLLPKRPQHPFIVMNGDLLTEASYDSMLRFHEDQLASGTMAVREYNFQVPYGVVSLKDGKITGIEEKPTQKHFVNAGIYSLSPEALDLIPSDDYFDMPTLFEKMLRENHSVVAFPLREYWVDIGRAEELESAQLRFTENQK